MKKNPKVDDFLRKINHPKNEEILRIREIILDSDDRIEETIKWNSPTFMYKGNMASVFMNAKKFVSVMFHQGAAMKNKAGLLEGDAKQGRMARFMDLEDIEKKKKALKATVKEWIEMKDSK